MDQKQFDSAEVNQITTDEIQNVQNIANRLLAAYQQNILGQTEFINSILISLLCEGHLLVESVPGLAKTRAVRVVAEAFQTDFKRVQFTPDLLPSDIVGTQIYNQSTGEFKTELGPIFTNVLLADEINRAPAKVQSAMLEAMAERQLSIAGETFKLPRPFVVMATQNPIEQEGTYELPEAQLDRFFMKQVMTYPTLEEEISMLTMLENGDAIQVGPDLHVKTDEIINAQKIIQKVFVSEAIKKYMCSIIAASRQPSAYGLQSIENAIRLPLSPRATVSLMLASRAQAVLSGRGYVTPDDIKSISHRVLRHRLGLKYDAELNGQTADKLIDQILATVTAP